jgi:hypothetical protein
MTETRLADVFVPEPFAANQIERTSEKFEFYTSGIIMGDPQMVIGSGKTLDLPFYQDLSGADNVWDDTTDIELNKIDMAQDTAAVLTREKAWGATDLSAALGQDDPMGAIQQLVDGYWARRMQVTLINILAGAMTAVGATNTLDISSASGAASNIDGEAFVDATQKLGDHSDALTAVAMHSATEASLRKQDLIDFIPDSEGKSTVRQFQGRRVIIDDGMPVDGGAYTTYLFAPGSVSWGEEVVENANEPHRHAEKSGGTDALYTRRKFVLHPRGVRWTPGSGVPASATPSNTELAASGNWTRVWEPQNIRIVKFVHTIA